MTYSAVSAKIRAMQGRFLTDTDFSQLAFSDSVSAAVETLKSRPSYSCAFEAAGDGELDRSRIEQLLWLSLYRDYSSLYRFAAVSQRKFLDLYFMHFEVDILKKCLRDAASSRSSDLDLSICEDFFQKHSHLDLAGLVEGAPVNHVKYGDGVIRAVQNNKVKIYFPKPGKELLLDIHYCMSYQLLRLTASKGLNGRKVQ